MSKYYTNSSNANRAAKKAGLVKGTYEIQKDSQGFHIVVSSTNEHRETPAQVKPTTIMQAIGIAAAKAATKASKGKKAPKAKVEMQYTLERNRDTKHGITAYSAGTMGAQLWELCDKQASKHGGIKNLTTAMVKDAAKAANLNATNAGIEFYRWRRFNGIIGRIHLKKAQSK